MRSILLAALSLFPAVASSEPERRAPPAPRCRVEWERTSYSPNQVVAGQAAALLAIGGEAARPEVPTPSHAPADQFHIDWALALAIEAAGGKTEAAFDRALASAKAIANPTRRDQALVMGALHLEASGAAKWAKAIKAKDFQLELSGQLLKAEVQRGDFKAAAARLKAMPPLWGVWVRPTDWWSYPAGLTSQAGALCEALTPLLAGKAAEARKLLEAVESASKKITEDWRKNGAWRAIAIGWLRLGDFDRAIAAAAKMPGLGERSATLADVVANASGDLGSVAMRAVGAAGMPSTPALLLYQGGVIDKEKLRQFVVAAEHGVLISGIALAHVNRGEPGKALAVAQSIPEDFAIRFPALAYYLCANDPNAPPDQVASFRPAERGYLGAFHEGLVVAGCPAHARRSVASAGLKPEELTTFLEVLIRAGYLDEAEAQLRASAASLPPLNRVEQLALLVDALEQAGNPRAAAALVRQLPANPFPNLEKQVAALGLRLVPALVKAGAKDDAAKLRAELYGRAGLE